LKYLQVNGSSNVILILSSELQVKSKSNGTKALTNTQVFHSQCGESDTSTYNKSKVDPVLKVYPHCPIMLNENSDVRGGVANGSQGTVEGVELKTDATIHQVKFHEYDCKAVLASEVNNVRIKLLALHHLCEKKIVPKDSSFTCQYPLPIEFQSGRKTRFKLRMKARQVPMVSNSATTGHKLQGASKDNLYIPFWHYGTPNWPYVMISRVRTRHGLYIGERLDPDKNYELDSRITRMLQKFEMLVPEEFIHDY
jgi:hypothetical protein